MFQKILVALDNTEESKQALQAAIPLVKVNNAELMLLHVLSHSSEGYPEPVIPAQARILAGDLQTEVYRTYAQQWEQFEQRGLEMLQTIATSLQSQGIVPEYTQLFGEAGHKICELARTWNADLVVLGRRGYTGIKEMILGSVSNYVSHHAGCSVLIVQESSSQQGQQQGQQ